MQLKTSIIGAVLSVTTGLAMAQSCSCAGGTRLNQTQIPSVLGGRTACAVLSTDRWQEFHTAGSGVLLELGNTPGGENVGTWSVTGTGSNAVVTYNYTGGDSYSYQLCEEGTGATVESRTYHFCGVRNITNAKLVAGTGTCGTGFTRP